jgi:hypothetical protein
MGKELEESPLSFRKRLRIVIYNSNQTNETMKVTKHYEHDHVMLYVEEGDLQTCITLDSDRQIRRLAQCLTDLDRTAGLQVIIGEE